MTKPCPGEPDFQLVDVNGMTFRQFQSVQGKRNTEGGNKTESGKIFTDFVSFPAALIGQVYGKHRQNLNNLREQTGVNLIVDNGDEGHRIIVSSESSEKLAAAVDYLKSYIQKLVQNLPFTHFVAIPCISSKNFTDSAKKWLDQLRMGASLHSDAYQNLKKLHMTLVLLRLNTEAEIKLACDTIKETVDSFNWTGNNEAEVAAVDCFGDQNRVFWFRLTPSDTLAAIQALRGELTIALREAKLDVVEEIQVVHVTILREKWCKTKLGQSMNLLQRMSEARVPPIPVESIVLCDRSEMSSNGFYKTDVIVPLTKN